MYVGMALLSQPAQHTHTLPTENVALQVFQAFESIGECLLPDLGEPLSVRIPLSSIEVS